MVLLIQDLNIFATSLFASDPNKAIVCLLSNYSRFCNSRQIGESCIDRTNLFRYVMLVRGLHLSRRSVDRDRNLELNNGERL